MTFMHKILLVDDVDFFLEMERELLKRTPATILTAKNGREALRIAAQERPHLIYMDVTMPVMDGIACCRALKADPLLQSIPIIMVFTPTQEIGEAAVRAAGCDAFLTKPVDRKSFLELGHRFLFGVDRREERVPCQMTVDFRLDGRDYQGLGHDLSPHGIYIQYREPVPLDANIYLSFLLPTISSRPVEARGRIAWVNQGFPRTNLALPQGFGVEFQHIRSDGKESIRRYLAKYGGSSDAG